MSRMLFYRAFVGLTALSASAAAVAATAESQRSALSVTATVVPSCEVAVSADAARLASAQPATGDRLAAASCTPGEAPRMTVERAPPVEPASSTAAANGTLYVTLTY